jgi:hypothetical protein
MAGGGVARCRLPDRAGLNGSREKRSFSMFRCGGLVSGDGCGALVRVWASIMRVIK